MDKIWDRKSFEVGGHWPLWQNRQKRRTLKSKGLKGFKVYFIVVGFRFKP